MEWWYPTIPPISTNETIAYNLQSLKKDQAYDATNSGPGLGQVLKCGEAKPDLLCLSSKNSTYKDSGLFSE